jgi:hypothetical protein
MRQKSRGIELDWSSVYTGALQRSGGVFSALRMALLCPGDGGSSAERGSVHREGKTCKEGHTVT